MHDNDNPQAKEWALTLEPGAKLMKKLSTTDSSQKSGVKYSYAFRVEQLTQDTKDIIDRVKTKGKKKQIQYNDVDYDIYFYSCFFQKKFYFYFENNERGQPRHGFGGCFKIGKWLIAERHVINGI